MIASYPNRQFQFWEYTVSHGSLLVRSPKGLQWVVNIDVMFFGVQLVLLPRHLNGIEVREGSSSDVEIVSQMYGQGQRSGRVFVIVSEGRRYFVVAAGCTVAETTMDIFDSPFV
jgi:hypothetical protein